MTTKLLDGPLKMVQAQLQFLPDRAGLPPLLSQRRTEEEAAGNATAGKEVFANYCQTYHDPESEETSVGPGLKGLFESPPHTLADDTEHEEHRVELIRDQIINGSSMMAPVTLSYEELENLIAYLKTL